MADSTTSPATGTPASGPSWNDGAAPFAKLNLALQASAMRDSLELARANSRRMLDRAHGLPPSPDRPEDMIAVDSPTTVVNHHYPPAAAAPAAIAAAEPLKPLKTAGTLAKIALAFAVSGPIGAGIAALPLVARWVGGAASSVAPPATPMPAAGDTSSPATPTPSAGTQAPVFQYELRLGK